MKITKYQSIALVLLILNIVYLLLMYSKLPETMPHHFNIKGEADSFGDKNLLLIIPVIAAVVYLIMYAAASSDKYNLPKSITIETARKSMGQLTVSLQIIFLLISYASITTGLGDHNPLSGWMVPILLTLIFLPIIGMYLSKK